MRERELRVENRQGPKGASGRASRASCGRVDWRTGAGLCAQRLDDLGEECYVKRPLVGCASALPVSPGCSISSRRDAPSRHVSPCSLFCTGGCQLPTRAPVDYSRQQTGLDMGKPASTRAAGADLTGRTRR